MSTYKPPMIKGGSFGPSGLAKIEFSGDGKKVRVSIKDDKAYVIARSECPENIQKGVWYVQLSSDKKKVNSIRPTHGTFTCKVEKFAARDGEQPAPKTNAVYDYQYFTVVLEIVKGPCKGMNIPVTLRYNFKEVTDEDGKQVVGFMTTSSKIAKHTPFLIKFCDVTGVWERGAMMYKDNILPGLQKRILAAEKEFDVLMEDGWVSNFITTSVLESEVLPADEAPWGEDAEDAEDTLADKDGME